MRLNVNIERVPRKFENWILCYQLSIIKRADVKPQANWYYYYIISYNESYGI